MFHLFRAGRLIPSRKKSVRFRRSGKVSISDLSKKNPGYICQNREHLEQYRQSAMFPAISSTYKHNPLLLLLLLFNINNLDPFFPTTPKKIVVVIQTLSCCSFCSRPRGTFGTIPPRNTLCHRFTPFSHPTPRWMLSHLKKLLRGIDLHTTM